jgi:hypothetical protein
MRHPLPVTVLSPQAVTPSRVHRDSTDLSLWRQPPQQRIAGVAYQNASC